MKSNLPRRDLCFLVGRRANKLSPEQGSAAWFYLSGWLEALGNRDMPKFADLLESIREATINAHRTDPAPQEKAEAEIPSPSGKKRPRRSG